MSQHTQPNIVISHATFPCEYVHARNQRIDELLPEILMTKESCNMNEQVHFNLQLVNQNFQRYEVWAGKQRIVISFILGYFHQKIIP